MNILTVDDIWKGLRALGSSVPHNLILASAERQRLYLTGTRSKGIPEDRLGELTKDLGVRVHPEDIVKLYSDLN